MICGHGHEQKFKYPYPQDSKIIQMPWEVPRAREGTFCTGCCRSSWFPPPWSEHRAIKVKKFPLPDVDHNEEHQTTVNLRVQTQEYKLKRLGNSTLLFPRQIISRRGRQGSGISFPDSQSTCKGKNKSLMLVNCLPLLYLKQQISGITRWKWIYITKPELTPSAIFHVHEEKVSLRSSIWQGMANDRCIIYQ